MPLELDSNSLAWRLGPATWNYNPIFLALSFPTCFSLQPPLGLQWVAAWTVLIGREVVRWKPDTPALRPLSLAHPWGLPQEQAPVRSRPALVKRFICPHPPWPTHWSLTLQNTDNGTILCVVPQFLHLGESPSTTPGLYPSLVPQTSLAWKLLSLLPLFGLKSLEICQRSVNLSA